MAESDTPFPISVWLDLPTSPNPIGQGAQARETVSPSPMRWLVKTCQSPSTTSALRLWSPFLDSGRVIFYAPCALSRLGRQETNVLVRMNLPYKPLSQPLTWLDGPDSTSGP